CAWWLGRCRASSSTSAGNFGRGLRRPSGMRRLTSRLISTPAARPEAPHEPAASQLDPRAYRPVPGRACPLSRGGPGTYARGIGHAGHQSYPGAESHPVCLHFHAVTQPISYEGYAQACHVAHSQPAHTQPVTIHRDDLTQPVIVRATTH